MINYIKDNKNELSILLSVIAVIIVLALSANPDKARSFQPFYNQTACNGTSSQIIPPGSYTLFYAQNQDGSNNVFICPAATCTAATGLNLTNTGTAGGTNNITVADWNVPWSCITSGATVKIAWYVRE